MPKTFATDAADGLGNDPTRAEDGLPERRQDDTGLASAEDLLPEERDEVLAAELIYGRLQPGDARSGLTYDWLFGGDFHTVTCELELSLDAQERGGEDDPPAPAPPPMRVRVDESRSEGYLFEGRVYSHAVLIDNELQGLARVGGTALDRWLIRSVCAPRGRTCE